MFCLFLFIASTWLLSAKVLVHTRYILRKRHFGCVDPPRYPHYDPIWGIDLFIKKLQALSSGDYLVNSTKLYGLFTSKTFMSRSFGGTTYHTTDPNVVKNYQSIFFKDFGIEPLRYHLAENLWGNGIVVADGQRWASARSFIRSSFDVVHTANIERLEFHVAKLMDLIPRDGTTVDMMPLFKRLILDTSSEFIFGQSLNALDNPDISFMQSFEYAQRGTGLRMLLRRLRFLHRDPKWYAACKTVTDFCDQRVEEAIERLGKGEERRTERDRLRLVDEAAKLTTDRYTLRSLILGVFSPAHDGAAVALSNVFFHLARHPRVWNKLRTEIMKDASQPITYDLLNSYTFLKNIFRECKKKCSAFLNLDYDYSLHAAHRLTPIVNGNQRVCLNNVVLPCGGGVNGKEPLYCRKGDIVEADYRTMMRDPEFWGPDAETFLPERWEKLRPGWEYLPFGGGPRQCPGMRLVFTECAFTTVRILREFEKLENRDDELEWKEQMRMTWQSKNGTLVGLVAG